MLRQHVYYSITFIPGQFSPDIWTVPAQEVVKSFDSVNVINSDSWEVSEKLWHRSTLFTGVIFSENEIKLNETKKAKYINCTVFNENQVVKSACVEGLKINSFIFDDHTVVRNVVLSSRVLRGFLFSESQIERQALKKGYGSLNVILGSTTTMARLDNLQRYSVFKGFSFLKDTITKNQLSYATSATTYNVPTFNSKVKMKGKVTESWITPTFTSKVKMKNPTSSNMIFGNSFKSSASFANHLRNHNENI